MNDRVKIINRDYRDVEGQFDKVASIEMFEAVGELLIARDSVRTVLGIPHPG